MSSAKPEAKREFVKQEPTGSFKYVRSYETVDDRTANTQLPPTATRFRSYSMGEMDAAGSRTKREHFHEDPSHGLVSSGPRANAGPHDATDTGDIAKTAIMRTVKAADTEFPPLVPTRKS